MPSTDSHFETTSLLFSSLGSYWRHLQNERPLEVNHTLTIDRATRESEAYKLKRGQVEELIIKTMSSSNSWLRRWHDRAAHVGELKQLLLSPNSQLFLSASLFAYCANTSDFFHPDDYFEAARLYIAAGDYRRAGEAFLAAASNPSALLAFELSADVYKEAAAQFVRAGELQLADYAFFMRIELAAKNGDYGRKLVFMKDLLAHFEQTKRPIFASQISAQISSEARHYEQIANQLGFAERARRAGDVRCEVSALLKAAELWLRGGSVEYAKKSYMDAINASEGAGLFAEAGKLRLELLDVLSGSSAFSYREQAEMFFNASQNFKAAIKTYGRDQTGKIIAAETSNFKSFSRAIACLLPFALHPSTGASDKERIIAMMNQAASGDQAFFHEMRTLLWPAINTQPQFSIKSRAEKLNIVRAYLEIAYSVSEKMLNDGRPSLALRFMFEALGDIKSLTYPGSECRAVAGSVTLDFARVASEKMTRPFSLQERIFLWYVRKTLRRELLIELNSDSDIVESNLETAEKPVLQRSSDIADGIARLESVGKKEEARLARLKYLGPALEAEGKVSEAIELYETLSHHYLIETQNVDVEALDRKNAILADALCRRGRLMLQRGSEAEGDLERGNAVLNHGYAIYSLLLKNTRAANDGNSWILIRAITELLYAGRVDYAFALIDSVAEPKSVSPEAFEHVYREVIIKKFNGDAHLINEFFRRAKKIVGLAYGEQEAMEFVRKSVLEGSGGAKKVRARWDTESLQEVSLGASSVVRSVDGRGIKNAEAIIAGTKPGGLLRWAKRLFTR